MRIKLQILDFKINYIISGKQLINSETYKHTIRTKKIEGKDVPYFQLNYTDGTLCDLNEKPRQTNVLYMCFDHVRNEIYSIKEVSTCSYEAIIFTPLLCKHPLYRYIFELPS